MNLYEMSANFADLFDRYDSLMELADEMDEETRANAEEAWFTSLDTLEEDIEAKIENLAFYILHMQADIEEMKAMEKRIATRRKVKENAVKRLKEYGITCMDMVHLTKVDRPRVLVSVRNNAESVQIEDEKAFIEWAAAEHTELLKYAAPTISKTEVKAFLAKNDCPYAKLQRTRSLIIK